MLYNIALMLIEFFAMSYNNAVMLTDYLRCHAERCAVSRFFEMLVDFSELLHSNAMLLTASVLL